MKKVTTVLSALFLSFIASSSFASMEITNPGSMGKEYVGKVVATTYTVENNKGVIRVMTTADNTMNNNTVAGATLKFTDNDLQMGMTLAANVGKDIDVSVNTSTGSINFITIITDEYWNGSKK